MTQSPDAGPILVRIDDRGPHGHVATVSINNQARLNSLPTEAIVALIDTVRDLSADPDLRCLIVTGEGDRSFVGGANLLELEALTPDTARILLTRIHTMCQVLRDLPVPTIARVNGFCLGAGLELMAACDMHIASDNAVFGMPEVKIGVPSVVEAALLPQLIGWAARKSWFTPAKTSTPRPPCPGAWWSAWCPRPIWTRRWKNGWRRSSNRARARSGCKKNWSENGKRCRSATRSRRASGASSEPMKPTSRTGWSRPRGNGYVPGRSDRRLPAPTGWRPTDQAGAGLALSSVSTA